MIRLLPSGLNVAGIFTSVHGVVGYFSELIFLVSCIGLGVWVVRFGIHVSRTFVGVERGKRRRLNYRPGSKFIGSKHNIYRAKVRQGIRNSRRRPGEFVEIMPGIEMMSAFED